MALRPANTNLFRERARVINGIRPRRANTPGERAGNRAPGTRGRAAGGSGSDR